MRSLALIGALLALGQCTVLAAPHKHKHKAHHKTHRKHHAPKNEITKLEHDRKTDPTVRQVTPDPKKSPGKHADNLSKNVNHELNRESKDINHLFQGKKKKK